MTDKPVVLITGTRKGIGKYLAEQFVARGWAVVGCSREPAGWELPGYTHVLCDVANEDDVKRLHRGISKLHDRLDATINNAGIASMNHFALVPVASLDRILATNVRGTFLISRESVKLMRKRNYGRIVNMTTVAVPMRLEGESSYVASKGAIEAMTRVIAKECAQFGITVNAVGPTPVETDLIKSVPPDKIAAITNAQAVKRLGLPRDVDNLCEFFCRKESDFITGQIVYLGGA